MLNSFSKEAINRVRRIRFFENIGLPLTCSSVSVSESMEEAAGAVESVEWMNLRLRWGNFLTGELSLKCRQEFRQWNRIIDEVELQIPLGGVLPLPEGSRCDLPECVLKNLRWDIIEYVMERHFSPIREQCYFALLIQWYEAGRMPCGWNGEFPQGKLIVY